jgi:hypothetical protein
MMLSPSLPPIWRRSSRQKNGAPISAVTTPTGISCPLSISGQQVSENSQYRAESAATGYQRAVRRADHAPRQVRHH